MTQANAGRDERKTATTNALFQAMQNDKQLNDAVAYNARTNLVEKREPLPWDSQDGNTAPCWNESIDLAYIQARLEEYYKFSDKAFQRAFQMFMLTRMYDPLHEAFDELPAVRVNRETGCYEFQNGENNTWHPYSAQAGHLFERYLDAGKDGSEEELDYIRTVEMTLLRGIVARAYYPGCKFDYMVVLVGAQGAGKSSMVRALAMKDEFFLESFDNFGVEGQRLLPGHLVAEVPELDAFRKSEMSQIKATISAGKDTFRKLYTNQPVGIPRTTILIGTTNELNFLTDKTGNRRFLPIRCARAQCDRHPGFDNGEVEMSVRLALAETRLQMVKMDEADGEAEALARSDGDASRIRHSFLNSLVIPPDMLRYASETQREYLEEDQVSILIRQYLENLPGTDELGKVPRVNVHMLLYEVFEFSDNEIIHAPRYLTSNITRILDNDCPGWHRMKGKQRLLKEYGHQFEVVPSFGIATTWERNY
jgi:hypothetical protein